MSTRPYIQSLGSEGVEAVPLGARSAREAEVRHKPAVRAAPVERAPDALRLPAGRPRRGGIFGLETYRRGWFEVQDAGSQCIAQAVADSVLAMVGRCRLTLSDPRWNRLEPSV